MRVDTLKKIDRSLISKWHYDQPYEQFNYALREGGWIDSYCKDEESPCFVCRLDDIVLGVFLFIPSNNNEFRVLVNPSYLNMGYGKDITKEAITTGFGLLSYDVISLIVRKNHNIAISMYKKIGFKIIGDKSEYIDGMVVEFHVMRLDRPTSLSDEEVE